MFQFQLIGVQVNSVGSVRAGYVPQEWFDSFHEFVEEEPTAMEGICGAGELVFVPTGWAAPPGGPVSS